MKIKNLDEIDGERLANPLVLLTATYTLPKKTRKALLEHQASLLKPYDNPALLGGKIPLR